MEASKLNQILEQHKLWLETNEVQGERANLTDADLYCANLTDADLYGADLEGTNLRGAKLYGATLTRANLTRANLQGAYLKDAILENANLENANLQGANLWDANLKDANLSDAVGLPNVSWIIPGCLVQLNRIKHYGFYLEKEDKWVNFVQDSFGFFIQNNPIEKTFDMLVEDRVIRGIPDWVKYSGLKQVATV